MRILVALDESTASLRAAREAARLFGATEHDFLIINVSRLPVPWIPSAAFGAVGPMPPFEWDQLEGPSEAEITARAELAGVDNPEVITDAGDPVARICAAAEDHDVDVVVVGSHDRGTLWRLLDPSVAEGVVRGIYRPVLVVSGQPPAAT